jgi:hypothetical protein
MEKGKLNCRGKAKIKFPSLAVFVCEKVSSRAAMLREIIIEINCVELKLVDTCEFSECVCFQISKYSF